MIKPINMSEVRVCAGEGKLAAHDVLAACNAVLRMRTSDNRVNPTDILTIKRTRAGKCVLMAYAIGYVMARRPGWRSWEWTHKGEGVATCDIYYFCCGGDDE